MRRFAPALFAAAVFLPALLPAAPQTQTQTRTDGAFFHFPSPSPGRPGEVAPIARFRPANNQPYSPTAEEKQQILAKTSQLGSMIGALKDVVLFGDPGSNLWIGRMNGKLPVNWTRESVAFGGHSFPAAESVPAFIYPNPMSPSKYVVVNSGLTADWQDWAGDHPTPQLGDFAVLKVKEGSEEPVVAFAGVFDESWKLP